MRVTAEARTNIALVKYWGKRDAELNIPATSSLSLTLDALGTRTVVERLPGSTRDEILLDGRALDGRPRQRVVAFLDRVREQAGTRDHALVDSENSVPTGAGLASSASGFAALALAASRAYGLYLSDDELSALARQGSASAARSVHGGFVELVIGERYDGRDTVARPVAFGSAGPPDVRLVVAVCGEGEKAISSTEAMNRTAGTSIFYPAWLAAHAVDLEAARDALRRHDLAVAGEVVERNAIRMHATAMGAVPPILYWNAATLAALAAVRRLREQGLQAYGTMDAGPHVKVLCAPTDAGRVQAALEGTPGVVRALTCAPGGPARVVEERA